MSHTTPLPAATSLDLATDPAQHTPVSHSTFPTPSPTSFPLGTRASPLALIQTELAAAALAAHHPTHTFPVTPMSVLGDRNKSDPLYLLTTSSSSTPAKSLWTEELELALLAGQVDMIVHSCKDVPTQLPEGCEIGAILKRADPRDALVVKTGLGYKELGELPDGAVVGTSSVRRIAQLRRKYPTLEVMDMRGNLDTRLRKLDAPTSPFSALLLASAGLHRLSLSPRVTAPLSSAHGMYHAVGQGAVAIEIRASDARVREVLANVGDWETEWAVGAERGGLRELEGGCSVPVGVETMVLELGEEEDAIPWAFPTPLPAPTATSPLLHHSGRGKLASLTLTIAVTSLNGEEQAVWAPGARRVRSWREAEEWGVVCARGVRGAGGERILREVEEVRRGREGKKD